VPDPVRSFEGCQRFFSLDLPHLTAGALWAERTYLIRALAERLHVGRRDRLIAYGSGCDLIRENAWITQRIRDLGNEARRRRRAGAVTR
jgi:hypothetical protein